MTARRVVALTAALAALVGLTAAAIAYACVPQAVIRFDSSSARAGDQVTGQGTGFSPSVPVEVNLDDLKLGTGTPDVRGRFSFAFAAPALKPGYYVVTAAPVGYAGDPARAVLEITGAGTQDAGGDAPVPYASSGPVAPAQGATQQAAVDRAPAGATAQLHRGARRRETSVRRARHRARRSARLRRESPRHPAGGRLRPAGRDRRPSSSSRAAWLGSSGRASATVGLGFARASRQRRAAHAGGRG